VPLGNEIALGDRIIERHVDIRERGKDASRDLLLTFRTVRQPFSREVNGRLGR
jgi:hypothetical protein